MKLAFLLRVDQRSEERAVSHSVRERVSLSLFVMAGLGWSFECGPIRKTAWPPRCVIVVWRELYSKWALGGDFAVT